MPDINSINTWPKDSLQNKLIIEYVIDYRNPHASGDFFLLFQNRANNFDEIFTK